MNIKFKRLLSAFMASAIVMGVGIIAPLAEDTLPTDGLLMNITFDEENADKTSFAATLGGTVTKKGSVSLVSSLDEESGKAMSITSNAAGNYLELPKGILNGKDAATFSFWIKPSSGWAFMTTPVSGAQDYLNEKYLGMLATSSTLTTERFNNSGTRLSSVITNGTYMDWQYVTAVFDANGTKVYINGQLVGSDTANVDVKSLMTADASTWIGHGNWGSGEGFSGMIDDFRIYGRALNESEITALAAKAAEREEQQLLKENNCIQIDTRFYSSDNTEIFSINNAGSDIYSAKISVKNYTESNKKLYISLYAVGNGSEIELTDQQAITVNSAKSTDLTFDFKGDDIPQDTVKIAAMVSEDASVNYKTAGNNVTVNINSSVSKTVDIIAASYTADGVLTNTVIEKEKQLNEGVNSFTIDNVKKNDTDTVKAYVWNSTSGLKPIGMKYTAASLYCGVVSPQIAPADSAETTFGAHDPSIVKFPNDDTYYVYSSHHLIFTSEDLINWTKHDFTNIGASTISPKTNAFISSNYTNTAMNGTYWAPDVIYKEGDDHPYWAYISLSCGLGGRNSAISLMKSTSPLFWADKDADIIDAGIVFATKEADGYITNAIDANIYTDTTDNNKQYFVWGSFWGGIQAAPLKDDGFVEGIDYTSDATILSSCKNFGTSVFTQKNGVAGPEGAWMIEHGDYRYMFTSYGWLGSNYNTRVARSPKSVKFSENMGTQLVDANGVVMGTQQSKGSLSRTTGYKLIGSYRLGDGNMEITTIKIGNATNYHVARDADDAHIYYGPGHNSVINTESGETFYISHTRKDEVEGAAYLQARKLIWTEDGWPVVSPVTYAGETEQPLPKDMLVGTYDLASVGHTKMIGSTLNSSGSLINKNYDLPVLSSKITLNSDGTLSDGLGTWEFDGNHKITITFAKDGNAAVDEFYKSGDVFTMYALLGYDKDEQSAVIALTGTDQKHVTQFAKKNLSNTYKITPAPIETTPTVVTKSTLGNPILGFDADGNTMYAGDPAALVDGDTVYLYAGHDTSTADGYKMPEWVCYSSKDMQNWKYEGVTMEAKAVSWRNDDTSAWASQVIKYGDKYYMYFCTWDKTSSRKQSIGVAVSDSPTGPFVDKGTPLIKGTLTEPQADNHDDIDPTVWVETVDGEEHRYLAWGNTKFYVCELNEDMISVKDLNGDGQIKMNDDIKQQEFKNLPDGLGFTEAPWIYRRTDENGKYTGKYYMFGAFGWREQMGYVTSDSMYGPWEWGGVLMPPTATSNTNHPSVIDFKGKTYFIYHNGSLPWGSGYRRVVCVERFEFNEDGSINPIRETASGLTQSDGVCELITISFNGAYGTFGDCLYHEKFDNPSGDSDYPLKKQIYGSSENTLDFISESKWRITPGKADSENANYVSIEANDKPGLYICTEGTNVILTQQDTLNESLAEKMTFKTVEGLSGGAVSFESVAKKGYFLTVENGVLTLSNGSNPAACTFHLSWLIGSAE